MQERVIEIILFLVSELRSNKRLNDVDIALLTSEGYTQTEISTAFSWVFERLTIGQSAAPETASDEMSHRQLNDAEKMVITPEAFGYLVQCKQLGLLTNEDVERIIERIMTAGFSSVGQAEMKSFIAGYLFDPDSSNGQINLWPSDTIH